MGHRFAEIAFTGSVQQVQRELGSRGGYAGMEGGDDYNHLLSAREVDFMSARDSFYMASVSETGWPYVQHRGGPPGFMRVAPRGSQPVATGASGALLRQNPALRRPRRRRSSSESDPLLFHLVE